MYAKAAIAVGSFAVASAVGHIRLRKERKSHVQDVFILSHYSEFLKKQTEFLSTKLDENGVEITEFDLIAMNNLM